VHADVFLKVPVLLVSAKFELVYTVYVNTVKPRIFKGNACNGHDSTVSTW